MAHEFETMRDRLKAVVSNREGIEAAIKATKKEMEAEIEPYTKRLKDIKVEEAALREGLIVHALANKESSGMATFAGVQYRETVELAIDPDEEAEIMADLLGEEWGGTALIVTTYSINKKALLEWAKARMQMGQTIPNGLYVTTRGNIALIKE